MVPNVEKRAVGTATVVGAHAARPKPLVATHAGSGGLSARMMSGWPAASETPVMRALPAESTTAVRSAPSGSVAVMLVPASGQSVPALKKPSQRKSMNARTITMPPQTLPGWLGSQGTGEAVGAGVAVAGGVLVGIGEAVAVGVAVADGVLVGIGEAVAVGVAVGTAGVTVTTGVDVPATAVGVAVAASGVSVGVGVLVPRLPPGDDAS